jgi:cysteine desulfurase
MKLDLAGFSVSSGSACNSGKVKESHVLKAMNVDDNMQEGAIRVSLGWGSNKKEVMNFISFFENIFNKTAKE